MFDKVPKLTYEKIGADYVGSAVDKDGDIIFSELLAYKGGYGSFKAFAGRELTLTMKDGSEVRIKDHWFDAGSYKEHGEFIGIGAGTLESLQRCYVYCSYNINKSTFQKMLDDYYSREKEYEYYEIEKWCKLQYKWYDVIIDGKKYPYMVNKQGNFVEKYSKEPIYPRCNYCMMRYYNKVGKSFNICLFKLNFKDGDRLIKIERKMIDILKESLPYSETKIKELCKIS
jgi:hypothetical protein